MRKALFFIVALLTAATAWAETQTVSYIDADGIEQTVTATVLTAGGWYDPGWYVVIGNIEEGYLHFRNGGPTNLILADGATLTLNSGGLDTSDAITIYGQRNGTGKFINIPTQLDGCAIRANGDINIHGGVIEAIGASAGGGMGITTMSWDEEQNITITGGKVTAVGNSQSKPGISAKMGNITITGGQVSTSGYYGLYVYNNGNITITGGQVNASGYYGIYIDQNSGNQYGITLGCTSESDFIYSSKYWGANVKIVDGQTLVDDDDNEYSGTYIEGQSAYNTLYGKTLHLPRTKYDITLPESFEHGTVTCNKQTASEGQTVTLTVTPDNGYELETLTVMNGATAVAVTPSDEDGKYTFVMPAAAVNVNATFTAIDYTITIADGIENGTVVADKHIANIGNIVTLTVTPNDGYSLDVLSIVTTGDNSVNVNYTMGNESNTYTFEMPNASVIIGATFRDIPPISQDGDTYTIHTAEGWDLFCDMLQGGESFSGKTVTLADNITVSRMAGSGAGGNLTASDRPFCGTFDGGGKTLTFNYGSSGTPADENNIAPFRYVNNATIQHLHVAGNIYTQHVHAGGIVGMAYGTSNITDCISSVNIVSSIDGDGTHGGIMSCSWTGSTTNITGCLFDGSIQSAEGYATDQCGGFVGWRNATINVTDCLLDADLSTIGVGTGDYPSATFVRHGDANRITNSYYTSTLGTPQGKQARSITAGENVTVANAGTPSTVYNVSGITAYPTGIKYNDVLYAGNGDNVSLTLGHSDLEGYAFNGYEASAGTLNGNANPYTLIMPDEDVVIGANYAATYVTYLDMDGNEQRCYDFTVLTGSEARLGAGWYVADGILNYNQAINPLGDVHIILMDNAVMNLGTEDSNLSGSGIFANGHSISIYGQSTGENMGQLNVYAKSCIGIINGNITICGGKVLATGHNSDGQGLKTDYGNITITGGEVMASGDYRYGIFAYYGNVTISGGKVTARGNYYGIASFYDSVTITGGQVTATGNERGIYAPDGDITLGWTNDSDFIYANSYNNSTKRVTIADGKAFIDEDNNIYSGTIERVNGSFAIDGKTLRPYLPALRGDVNGDGEVNITDVIELINYLLNDGGDIVTEAADFNEDGFINISDAITFINYLLNDSGN